MFVDRDAHILQASAARFGALVQQASFAFTKMHLDNLRNCDLYKLQTAQCWLAEYGQAEPIHVSKTVSFWHDPNAASDVLLRCAMFIATPVQLFMNGDRCVCRLATAHVYLILQGSTCCYGQMLVCRCRCVFIQLHKHHTFAM